MSLNSPNKRVSAGQLSLIIDALKAVIPTSVASLVTDTTLVPNLNADLLDGIHAIDLRQINGATSATGTRAFAAGYQATADSNYSVSLGLQTATNAVNQTVLGKYNALTADALVVGWGTSNENRANILTLSTAGVLTIASYLSTTQVQTSGGIVDSRYNSATQLLATDGSVYNISSALAAYLPLTGGTVTGKITLSSASILPAVAGTGTLGNATSYFSGVTALSFISPRTSGGAFQMANTGRFTIADSGGTQRRVLEMSAANNLIIGYGLDTEGYAMTLRAGTITLQGYNTTNSTRTTAAIIGTTGDITSLHTLTPATNNIYDLGSSSLKWNRGYVGNIVCDSSLAIPDSAPSSADSGKIYLYYDSTGSYAE